MISMRVWTSIGAAVVVAGCAIADQPTLLNVDTSCLSASGVAPGPQALGLSAAYRGVTAGGASRVASPFGWQLNADQSAVDEIASRHLGPVDLLTGAVNYAEQQLVLPAIAPWPIGVSFNNAQSSTVDGLQGRNWFQNSQPCVSAPDSNNVVRLFYAADAFVEYHRIDESNYYAGVNGAGGVLSIQSVTEGEHTVQIYVLHDQGGNEIVFFGHSGVPDGASGQLWKYTVAKSTLVGATDVSAYVGDISLPYTAAHDGYENGHIVTAFDSASRKYVYTYTSIGSFDRLTQVTALSGTTTIATVEYSYYGQSGITAGTNGTAGDLAMIRVTLPTSFGASGSDPAIVDVRENRFYYDGSSRLALVLGYEGTRRHLVTTGGSPVSWTASATTLATALNSLAELRVVYSGSTPRVASLWFDGMDGSGSSPSGQYDITYEHTAYTTPWSDRTVVKLPAFARFGGTTLSGAAETTASTWSTQYFDDIGQPLSSVVSDLDPATTSGTPKFWITGIERDSSRRLIAINTPANCSSTSYDHNATSTSRGTFTKSAADGLVTYFERENSVAARTGLVKAVRRGTGTGTAYASTNYVTYTSLDLQPQTLSASSPLVQVRKPIATATRVYPVATTSASTSGSYNQTTYRYDWWSGAPLVPQWVETTLPAIAVANNGINATDTRRTWYSHLGQAIVTQLPNKRLDTSEYDSTTGLLVRQTTDSSTPTSSFPHYGDLPTATGDKPVESTIGQEATPYNVVTEYSYDVLGRSSQTLSNPGSDFDHGRHVTRSFYTCLADRRIVRLDVPAVDDATTPVYCGPISAAVINHSGLVEEAGQISPSDPTVRATSNPSRFTTTAAPRTWLAAPSSTIADDCLPQAQHNGTAGGGAALVSYALSLTSPDGSRVIESRRYTAIPTSGSSAADFRGTANTFSVPHHFDYALAHYNALGMVDRTEDFTRTIERTSFDVLGRPVQHSRGTVDSGTTPAPNMRIYSSVVYDATNYGTYTSGNLNVPGGNSNVTQVFQHPGGAFNGSDDIHSFMRYDGLGNATNVWRDGGPFLASTVDNLDRVVSAAAFDGSVANWNTGGPSPTSLVYSGGYRQRYAETSYDERGRTCRRSVYAVNPSTGAASTVAGETMTLNTFWGANDVVKAQTGASTQMTARDRLCRPKTGFVTVTTSGSESQSDRNGELIAANPANSIVVQQTNIYRVPNSGQIVCTTRAERGTTDIVNMTGGPAIDSSTALPTFGALMDVPNNPVPTTNPPCLQIAYDPSISPYVNLGMRSGHAASNLLLDVHAYQFDALMMVPLKRYMLGDVLRHDIPPTQICCGIIPTGTTGCGTPFPGVTNLPFIEENTEFDPRRAVCRSVTTDTESGEQITRAQMTNAAGQVLHTMRARSTLTTTIPALPQGSAPLTPESGPGCCGETERTDYEWDKGRIKLERMFLCDPPSDPELFNPLTEGNWSGCSNGCPKTTSFGYPDYAPDTTGSGGGGFYPWNAPDAPTQTPNDNNLLLWNVRPIGGQPDINWHAGRSNGSDDADWYTYDYLGRPTRSYLFPFRKTTFGDGNAASGAPARHTFYGAGGYPVDWRTPSGDHLNPWERVNVDRDTLGRPTQMRHYIGDFAPTGTPTPNDAIDFGYDRFGMMGSYGQSFNGMFPSGCGSSGPLVCNLVREGTPQQDVKIGASSRTLWAWQGPRVVRQTLPVPNMEVGMAYFPDPSGTDDTTMYPGGGGGGYMPQLTEPRLNWALGRPTGIYQGDGTKHYDTPLTQYDYVGMAVPLYRSMLLAGGTGMDEWPGLPTSYAPVGRPGGSTPMTPIASAGIDWRHRTRTDVWRPGIDSQPSTISSSQYALLLEAEGPKSIVWAGSHLVSMLDPATSPDFNGAGAASPVPDFDINGHDEYTRYDCNWRPIYWLSGQLVGKGKSPTAAGAFQDAQNTWLNGLTSPTGVNSASPAKPGSTVSGAPAITEVEMRWPSSPTGCGSTGGASGWLMAPSGLVNKDHPLSPNYGTGGAGADEWGQHAGTPTTEGCDPAGINSRTVTEGRRMTSGGSEVNYVPPGVGLSTHYPRSFEYDAAGNVGFDGRFYYRYDGGNRLKDVYAAEWGTGSSPMMGNRRAHFDYDGFGRLIKSQHDTDADGSLSDEDSEWTPRDHLGRVMGIWRQAPTSGVCAKPYQVFAYHNTSFRGEGSDDSRGVLDAPAVRWRDTGSGGLDEMVSYLQDFRGDVRALVHPKYGVLERDRYGLTGRPEAFPAADVNFDGKVDSGDKDDFDEAIKQFSNDSSKYDPRADLDRDGDIDSDDQGIFSDGYGTYAGYSGQWKLSSGQGLSPGLDGSKAGLDNRFGWRGYWYDPHLQVYHVRNRAYDPRQGQFLQTDPLGFSAGDQNLYRYANGNFSSGYDPLGLEDPGIGDYLKGLWYNIGNYGGSPGDFVRAASATTFDPGTPAAFNIAPPRPGYAPGQSPTDVYLANDTPEMAVNRTVGQVTTLALAAIPAVIVLGEFVPGVVMEGVGMYLVYQTVKATVHDAFIAVSGRDGDHQLTDAERAAAATRAVLGAATVGVSRYLFPEFFNGSRGAAPPPQDGCGAPKWEPPKGFQMPAANKGRFLGEIGNSEFMLSDDAAAAMGLPRGSTVQWRQGVPDFGPYTVPGPNGLPSTFNVEGLTGMHAADRALIIEQMAARTGMSQRAVKQWLSANDVVLHHSGGTTIQIVPSNIHQLHHSGGALGIRTGNQ